MFTKRNPSQARPNGRTAPKGSVKGKTPSHNGHPVRGSGRKLGSGHSTNVTSSSNSGPGTGRRGHGGRGSSGGKY